MPIKKIWGFSDGYKFYINFGGEFFPLEFEDGRFTFNGYKRVKNNTGIMLGALAGGIVGTLFMDNFDNTNYKSLKKTKRKYIVDKVGRAIWQDKVDKMVLIARLYVGEKANILKVDVDSFTYEIETKSLVKYYVKPYETQCTICLEGEGNCLNINFSKERVKYILVEDKKTKEPLITKLDAEKGKQVLNIARALQAQKNKKKTDTK